MRTTLRDKAKARANAGETLVETMVALTIAGLALIMLAMAISVSANLVQKSRTMEDDYYSANSTLVQATSGTSGKSATVNVTPITATGDAASNPCSNATIGVSYVEESLPGDENGVIYWTTPPATGM